MAKGFYKLSATPSDVPRTLLDELAKVEKFLNRGRPVSDWIRLRVYFPQRETDEMIVWIMDRSPSSFIKNIVTIGVHSGHAFLIKDIKKLAMWTLFTAIHTIL